LSAAAAATGAVDGDIETGQIGRRAGKRGRRCGGGRAERGSVHVRDDNPQTEQIKNK
jgi:hypothetical protein